MRASKSRAVGHRWRDYRTRAGRRPMKDFVDQQSDEDASEIVAAMREVSREGIHVARHLRGEIYEVRAEGQHEKGRILLSLEAFSKKTRQTPTRLIDIAERRLADWRSRGG